MRWLWVGDGFTSYTLTARPADRDADELRIGFTIAEDVRTDSIDERDLIGQLKYQVTLANPTWIRPGRPKWVFDLDALQEVLHGSLLHVRDVSRSDETPETRRLRWLAELDWVRGKVLLSPQVETIHDHEGHARDKADASIAFYVAPDLLAPHPPDPSFAPDEIRWSLARFRADHPDALRTGFVMMGFGSTSSHQRIMRAIRECGTDFRLDMVRADEKEYHEDLYWNVLTYAHGSAFGIAVFERIEADTFNPNTAFEVGYMRALRKPVCFLKDRTLQSLQTDLLGKLYRSFDPQRATPTIRSVLTKWLKDQGIV